MASQRDLLSNQLVVIVPAGSTLEINVPGDLVQQEIRHLALADPKSVPAGIYAKQALEKLDLWKQLDELVAAHHIRWVWVKGHSGHDGNERADKLANKGVASLA